jgi:hypothetical protein
MPNGGPREIVLAMVVDGLAIAFLCFVVIAVARAIRR